MLNSRNGKYVSSYQEDEVGKPSIPLVAELTRVKESNPTIKESVKLDNKVDGRQVRGVDEHAYLVKSQSRKIEYDVLNGSLGWMCSCPDHIYRGVKCKHIWAV